MESDRRGTRFKNIITLNGQLLQVCGASAREKETDSFHDTINKWQAAARALVCDLYIYPRRCIIDFQMRGANLRSICIGVYRASASFSLSLLHGGADSSQRCKRGMLPVVRAHLIVVYIISVCRGIVSERAHREMLFFLSAERGKHD